MAVVAWAVGPPARAGKTASERSYAGAVLAEPGDLDRAVLKAALESHGGCATRSSSTCRSASGATSWRAGETPAPSDSSPSSPRRRLPCRPGHRRRVRRLDRASRTARSCATTPASTSSSRRSPIPRARCVRAPTTAMPSRRRPPAPAPSSDGVTGSPPRVGRRIAGVLSRMHATSGRVPEGLPRREDFDARTPRAELVEALRDARPPVDDGPVHGARAPPARVPRPRPGAATGRVRRPGRQGPCEPRAAGPAAASRIART